VTKKLCLTAAEESGAGDGQQAEAAPCRVHSLGIMGAALLQDSASVSIVPSFHQ
jgi:hypothetical protein